MRLLIESYTFINFLLEDYVLNVVLWIILDRDI